MFHSELDTHTTLVTHGSAQYVSAPDYTGKTGSGPGPSTVSFFLTVFMKRRMTNNNLITAAAKQTEENFSHQIRDMKGRSHLN